MTDLTAQGQVRYRLKTPYRDGTTHIVLEPLDFIARLAALVPPPRPAREATRMNWARRLKRVFGIEIEQCVRCGGRLKVMFHLIAPDLRVLLDDWHLHRAD